MHRRVPFHLTFPEGIQDSFFRFEEKYFLYRFMIVSDHIPNYSYENPVFIKSSMIQGEEPS